MSQQDIDAIAEFFRRGQNAQKAVDDLLGKHKSRDPMRPESNITARAAIDEAASAIQNLARAFTDDRTPNAVRQDIERARERLMAALDNIDTALRFM